MNIPMKIKHFFLTAILGIALTQYNCASDSNNTQTNTSINENIIPKDSLENKYDNNNNNLKFKTMEHLTLKTFKEKVFDYENNKEWNYIGELPCIIDFYADWCGPCRMVAPILEELSKEYAGKIIIYKVNTEQEQQLAAMFGIRSIPSILFIPKKGQPQMMMGAMPKANFENAIKNILLNTNNN